MGTHIHNLAKTMIGQLGITMANIGDDKVGRAATILYDQRHDQIETTLQKMRPETLGRIIAQGKGARPIGDTSTPMYSMVDHHMDWLGGCMYDNGMRLLVRIACMVIIAEMFDILFGTIMDAQETPVRYYEGLS